MQVTTTLLIILSATAAMTFAENVSNSTSSQLTGRNCGFKMAPCPSGEYCRPQDPSCTRGENCLGNCVPITSILATTLTTVPSPTPTSTPSRYSSCGGHVVTPNVCKNDEICVDDPYKGGCGMACDMTGVCVKPVFCGGFAGFKCKGGLRCVDDPRDDCDPNNGGADCGGICV